MLLEEAKQFVGKEVRFHTVTGKIVRVANALGHKDGEFLIAQLDTGFAVNLELLREEIDGKWEKLTVPTKVSHTLT